MSAAVKRKLMPFVRYRVDHVTIDRKPCPLTDQQLEVLRWIADGKRDDQVAEILGGNKTSDAVRLMIHRIMTALGCATRTGAAMKAKRFGWID